MLPESLVWLFVRALGSTGDPRIGPERFKREVVVQDQNAIAIAVRCRMS